MPRPTIAPASGKARPNSPRVLDPLLFLPAIMAAPLVVVISLPYSSKKYLSSSTCATITIGAIRHGLSHLVPRDTANAQPDRDRANQSEDQGARARSVGGSR